MIVYPAPQDQRWDEVRRALIVDDNYYATKRERRRLSAQEREALNRELRATLRGVYDKDRQRADASH